MHLSELLRPEDVIVDFHAVDKWDALSRMTRHLFETGRIDGDHAETYLEAVLARERSMSTGMERGIAIPHAAVEGLAEVVGCLAILGADDGLSFESLDAVPTHLIVLLLIPREKKLLHIRTLADIARILGEERVRQALRSAEDPTQAWSVLEEGDRASAS